ncbi:MAG: ABC transporter permease, partial [Methylovirgula sp.]
MIRHLARHAPPALAFAAFLLAWEAVVRLAHLPPFVLPAPSLVVTTLIADRAILFASLWVTLKTTFAALAMAVVGGSLLAILFSQWRWMERALLPFAVILQVTPIIAIAPLLLIYLAPWAAVLT